VKPGALALGAAALLAAAPARADESDLQQWTELGVGHGFDKETTISLDAGIRFDEDVSRVGAVLPEAGLQYRLAKWLRVGGGYRLQYARDDDTDEFEVRHRVQAHARVRHDVDPVRLEYRLMYQEAFQVDAIDRSRHTVRNRVSLAYRALKPWVPAAEAEAFIGVDDGDPVHVDKVRFTLGASHQSKAREIEAYYRIEVPVEDRMEPTLHILGLGMYFDL